MRWERGRFAAIWNHIPRKTVKTGFPAPTVQAWGLPAVRRKEPPGIAAAEIPRRSLTAAAQGCPARRADLGRRCGRASHGLGAARCG